LTVEAQSFVLRDAQGRMRAHLGFGADDDSVGLRLFDEREQSRVPIINLYNANGQVAWSAV
jgi:hypothetical protein